MMTCHGLILALAASLLVAGCGYRSGAGELTGVERFKCRKAEPYRHAECLERAEREHLQHHRY